MLDSGWVDLATCAVAGLGVARALEVEAQDPDRLVQRRQP